MNRLIERINFKKIVIVYLILLILVVSFVACFLGTVYKDKIQTLYNYHKLYELFEKGNDNNELKAWMNSLNKVSEDIIDVALIEDNDILYTTSNFYNNQLTSLWNTNNYYTDFDKNTYKLDTKEEFILELFNVKREDENEYYNEFKINTNSNYKYTINYLSDDYNSKKIVIIAQIIPIRNSSMYLKVSVSLIMLFFMVYWVIVALIIYQNALKLKVNAYFWGIVTLLTNFIGVITYLIFIRNRTICKNCCANISVNDNYCKSCGEKK